MKRVIANFMVIFFSTSILAYAGTGSTFKIAEAERLEAEKELEQQIKKSKEIIKLKRPEAVKPQQPQKLELPTITVLSPNGGETWYKGKRQSILWTSKSVKGNVRIMLMYGPGSEGWYTIDENASNTGSYTFTLPAKYLDGKWLYEEPDQYMIIIMARDQQVSDRSDARFSIVTPPDLALKDAKFQHVLSGHKLFFKIQNNGRKITNTPVSVRVIAYHPLWEYPPILNETTYTFTLDSGQWKWVETPIYRPDPLDCTQLELGMEIDWEDKVPEINEKNNLYQKTIRFPCGVRVNGIDKTKLKWAQDFTIYGNFGRPGTKQVYVEKIADKKGKSRFPIGEQFWIPVRKWTNSALDCAIPPDYELFGDYKLYVCCTDPSDGDAFKSNSIEIYVDVVIKGDWDWWLFKQETLDSRALADAIAEEFGDEMNFDNSGKPLPSPAIVIKQIGMKPVISPKNFPDTPPEYSIYCHFDTWYRYSQFIDVIYEIYRGETKFPLYLRSLRSVCHTGESGSQNCYANIGVYWSLRPGEHDIRCTVEHLVKPERSKVSSSARVLVP